MMLESQWLDVSRQQGKGTVLVECSPFSVVNSCPQLDSPRRHGEPGEGKDIQTGKRDWNDDADGGQRNGVTE